MESKINTWFEPHLRLKPQKVIVKLLQEPGVFKGAVNIPSVMWPLNGPYTLFHCNNTEFLEDEKALAIIDAQPYRTGFCYTNAERVTGALVEAGYDAKTYVGWLFCNINEWPIHHTWTVLDGKYVIEPRALYVDYHRWAMQLPHSKRTAAGRTSPTLLYVGCECTAEQGRQIYNNLIDLYPDHPCKERVGADNMTPMQKQLKEAGL